LRRHAAGGSTTDGLASDGPAATDGSAASHGPACGGTVVACAQRHTHGLCDVDGLAGLQGDVAADADGDGAQSVQVVRGAPERIVPGAHEDLVQHQRVTAAVPALAGGDVDLPGR